MGSNGHSFLFRQQRLCGIINVWHVWGSVFERRCLRPVRRAAEKSKHEENKIEEVGKAAKLALTWLPVKISVKACVCDHMLPA